VEFLDCWTELTLPDLLRLLAPAGFLAVATLIPGVRIVRLCAIGVALTIPLVEELGVTPRFTLAWSALWLLIAWGSRGQEGAARRPLVERHGVLETSTVGLLLGLALLTLLIAAVARQALSPEEARRASYGALLLLLGLLHLMLHGHVRRAGVAFGSLGLGLQVLESAAREAQVFVALNPGGAVLLATVLASSLAMRVAASRERLAGTAWVSDAHDLHD
jgi:hypothetical protein